VKSTKVVKIEGVVITLKVTNAVKYAKYLSNGMNIDALVVSLL
jgi:hypothetical protein